MEIITFGQFGNKKNLEEERKLFLKAKKKLVRNLSAYNISYEFIERKDETEIDELIEELKKEKKNDFMFRISIEYFYEAHGFIILWT